MQKHGNIILFLINMEKTLKLFKTLAKQNPKFNNELCNMFGGNIPEYIKHMANMYALENKKLCSNEFINTVPSYMLVNACENRHRYWSTTTQPTSNRQHNGQHDGQHDGQE